MPKLNWPKRPVEARETQVRFLGVPRRCRCEGDEILRRAPGPDPGGAGSIPARLTAERRSLQSVAQTNTCAVRFTPTSPTRLVQWESTCLTRRLEVVRFHHRVRTPMRRDGILRLLIERCGFESRRVHARACSSNGRAMHLARLVHGVSWDRSIDGDASGSYPGEQGSSPCDPTVKSRGDYPPSTPRPEIKGGRPTRRNQRKVADRGVQPASKAGPAAKAEGSTPSPSSNCRMV